MDNEKQETVEAVQNGNPKPSTGSAVEIAERGITTSQDFATLMSAMIQDLITGKMTPKVANATCNAGAKLLKVVEMQHIYGSADKSSGSKTLQLLATHDANLSEREKVLAKLSPEDRAVLGL